MKNIPKMFLDLGALLPEIYEYLPNRTRIQLALTCTTVAAWERQSFVWDTYVITKWPRSRSARRFRRWHLSGEEDRIPPFNSRFSEVLCPVELDIDRDWDGVLKLPPGSKMLRSLHCNKLMFKTLPDGLRQLHIRHLRKDLGFGPFPTCLRSLSIDEVVEKLRPGMLPASLIRLKIGGLKSELPPGVLPPGLLDLDLGNYAGPILKGALPSGLRCYEQKKRPHAPVNAALYPASITHLTIHGDYGVSQQNPLLYIFPNLTHLRILGWNHHTETSYYPWELRYLEMERLEHSFGRDQLPPQLTHLIVHERTYEAKRLSPLPPTLTYLALGPDVVKNPTRICPATVEYLQSDDQVYTRGPKSDGSRLVSNPNAKVPFTFWWQHELPYRI